MGRALAVYGGIVLAHQVGEVRDEVSRVMYRFPGLVGRYVGIPESILAGRILALHLVRNSNIWELCLLRDHVIR